MREIHYRNIGLPKTGTTYLGIQLSRNPFIDGQVLNEYKEFRPKNFNTYKNLYKNFNLSFNLDTHIFATIDDVSHYARPETIHEHTTHITMSFRNPYQILNSMYNMMCNLDKNYKERKDCFTKINGYHLKLYTDMNKIFDYWAPCRLPIKYLFFDDLINDPQKYVYDICNYVGFKPYFDKKLNFTLKTINSDPLVFDNLEVINYINNSIEIIENKTKRELSHWKKY